MNPKISWKYVYDDMVKKYPEFVKQHRVRWSDCKPDYSTTMTITFVTADLYKYKYDIYGKPPHFLEDLRPGRIKEMKSYKLHVRVSDIEQNYITMNMESHKFYKVSEYLTYGISQKFYGDEPPTKLGRVRDKMITIRITPSEFQYLDQKANKVGLTASAYARNMMLNNCVNPYSEDIYIPSDETEYNE